MHCLYILIIAKWVFLRMIVFFLLWFFSNPNQRHDTQWANEWRQYKWPMREHIVLDLNLSKNLFPEHGSALRADYCSFWLDFLPKLASVTCMSNMKRFSNTNLFCRLFFFLANISEEEARWKQEFRQYQERVQQWDYYYTKYLELLDRNGDKLLNCRG